MAYTDGFFNALRRQFINDRLRDIPRLEDTAASAAYSSLWLPEFHDPMIGGQNRMYRKLLDAALHKAAHMAAIILESKDYRIQLSPSTANFTDRPEDRTITVSYEPVIKVPQTYNMLDSIDVIAGQVIHDAACIRERQNPKPEAAHGETLIFLYRLVEEVIIDVIVTLQYPGFEGYLLKYRHYLVDWKLRNQWSAKWEGRLLQTLIALRSSKPAKIGRKSVRQAYFFMLYLLARNRSIEQLRNLNRLELAKTFFSILFDEKTYEHWGAVNHRSERFVWGPEGPPTPGESGSHIGKKGGKEFDPISDQTLQELKLDRGASNGESNYESESSEPDQIQADPSSAEGDFNRKLTPLEKRQLSFKSNRQAEDVQIKRASDSAEPPSGDDNRYACRIRVPGLYYGAFERYQEAVQAVQAHTTSLGTLSIPAAGAIQYNQFGLKSGSLDEDALYKVKFAKDLFMKPRKQIRSTDKLDIAVIVDGSSSMLEVMEGSDVPRYVAAQRMAALFVEAMERVDAVQTWVYSFSSRDKRVDILELYSPSLSRQKERIGDIHPFPGRQTPEYEALRSVIENMKVEGRKDVQKVFIVLSDGEPEDDILPRQEQLDKIRKLVIREKKKGNLVIQVSMGSQIEAGRAYPDSISFPKEGYPELIRSFSRLLRNLMSSG